MTKYLLADRERNYSDDSDFYAVYYDDADGLVKSEEYGSTRGYSPRIAPRIENDPRGYQYTVPDHIRAKARHWLRHQTFEYLVRSEERRVMEPGDAQRGDMLMTLKSGKWTDKKTGTVVTYLAGEVGEVIWSGAFGTFYANGYNKVGRQNIRVGLRLSDGRVVFIGLKVCRLAREPKTASQLAREACRSARGECYHAFFGNGLVQI